MPYSLEIGALVFAAWFFFWTFIWQAVWFQRSFSEMISLGLTNGNLIFLLIFTVSAVVFRYTNFDLDKIFLKLNQIDPKTIKSLFLVSVILFALSCVSLSFASQLSSYETKQTITSNYSHVADYDYSVDLKPNVIINKTTLISSDEERIYFNIVKEIDVSFMYNFSSIPDNEILNCSNEITVKFEAPDKWEKILSVSEAKELLGLDTSLDFSLHFNSSRIKEVFSIIDKETGAVSSVYNIVITPKISLVAKISGEKVSDVFSPVLMVEFHQDEKGDYITIGDLYQTKSETLYLDSTVYLEGVSFQKNGAFLFSAVSIVLLLTTGLKYFQFRLTPSFSRRIEKEFSSYKELIIKTAEKAPYLEQTITMQDLEDLKKTAEILGKPIFYNVNKSIHHFYVLENSTKYEFVTREK